MAVAIEPLPPETRSVRVQITMDERLLARVDGAARRRGETRSGFISEACRARLAALGPNPAAGEVRDIVGITV